MDVIEIRYRRYSKSTLIALDAIIVIGIVFNVFINLTRDISTGNALVLIRTNVLLLIIVVVLHLMARRKLLFDKNGISYTPMLGATKNISYHEIGKVDIGTSRSYTIYLKDGTKFASFLGDADHARDALNRMTEKGVQMKLF